MKKLYAVIIVFLAVVAGAYASPGDTMVVQTSPVLNADNSTNYDSLLVLPNNKTYRKIFLVYTLGSHACPAGSQYCHQWDYIGNVVIKPPHGDTVELARIITPFATSGWSRFPQPPNWKQEYVFDVTDFAPYLKDSVTINSRLGVGSPGYEISTKLVFVEGIPDRNVVGISLIYGNGNGYYGSTYGNAAHPINEKFPEVNKTAPVGTVSAALRFIVTGHGSDANQCCEFANHYYKLFLNGNQILQKDIWRDDCGLNPVYPQGGTWIYDRSNWCPGASVKPYYDALPGITAASNYNLKIAFEDYTVASPSGQYVTNASVFYYGNLNKTVDASMDDIISPSSDEQHFRQNPSSNAPVIKVHNSGSTAITSMVIEYGVADSATQQFTWNGSLASLADTTITLAPLATLTNMAQSSASGNFKFQARIASVNGAADVDATNDTLRSSFIVAPNWPGNIIVKFHPGNIGRDGSLSTSPAQGSWMITNAAGDTVTSRLNASTGVDYNDSIVFATPGYYKLTISNNLKDALGFCFGLHWWALEQTGIQSGALWVKNMNGVNIPMHGYTYATSTSNLENHGEHDDFGCEYTQYFYVSTPGSTGIDNLKVENAINVYPNPAKSLLNIEYSGNQKKEATVQLINISGKVVYSTNTRQQKLAISTANFTNGIYTLVYTIGDYKKIEKVVINK